MQCASILEHLYFWIYSLRYVDFLLFHSFFFFFTTFNTYIIVQKKEHHWPMIGR